MALAYRIARLRSDAALFPRSFWILWWGTLVNRLGLVVVPFLTLYLTGQRGLSASAAAFLLSGYGGGALVASLVGGDLADRIGRRRTILLSLVGGAATLVALPFVRPLPMLAGLVFLAGLAGEMYRPAVSAAVTDLVPDEHRGRAFALLYWVINVGTAVAPALGGFLVERSFVVLFVLDGFTMLAFAVFIALGVPESRPDPATSADAGETTGGPVRTGLLQAARDPALLALTGLSFLVVLLFFQAYTTLPLAMGLAGLGSTAFGLAVSANGALIVLLALSVARAVERRPPGLVLAGAAAVVAVGFGLHAPSATLLAFTAAVAVWTLGEMAFFPTQHALVARISPTHLRGSYQGLAGLAWGLGGIVGPAAGGLVLEGFGATALWLGCLAVGLVAAGGYLVLHRVFEQRLAVAPIPQA